jgi:hypothetical protein
MTGEHHHLVARDDQLISSMRFQVRLMTISFLAQLPWATEISSLGQGLVYPAG